MLMNTYVICPRVRDRPIVGLILERPFVISLYAIEKDCPDNAPGTILKIMYSGRHISVNWTILSN